MVHRFAYRAHRERLPCQKQSVRRVKQAPILHWLLQHLNYPAEIAQMEHIPLLRAHFPWQVVFLVQLEAIPLLAHPCAHHVALEAHQQYFQPHLAVCVPRDFMQQMQVHRNVFLALLVHLLMRLDQKRASFVTLARFHCKLRPPREKLAEFVMLVRLVAAWVPFCVLPVLRARTVKW